MSGAVVIGAGPAIGQAVARRFARAGMPVALIARSRRTVDEGARALGTTGGAPEAGAGTRAGGEHGARVAALTADVSDEAALRAALDAAADRFAPPDVVVYNAAIVRPDRVGELSARDHLDACAVNVVGAHTAAAHVAPAMARRGSGTFLVTSGMPRPVPRYVSLSLGKAGVRATGLAARPGARAGRRARGGDHRGRPGRAGHGLRSGRHRRALLAPARPATGVPMP